MNEMNCSESDAAKQSVFVRFVVRLKNFITMPAITGEQINKINEIHRNAEAIKAASSIIDRAIYDGCAMDIAGIPREGREFFVSFEEYLKLVACRCGFENTIDGAKVLVLTCMPNT